MIGRESQATVRDFLVKNYSTTIEKNETLLLNPLRPSTALTALKPLFGHVDLMHGLCHRTPLVLVCWHKPNSTAFNSANQVSLGVPFTRKLSKAYLPSQDSRHPPVDGAILPRQPLLPSGHPYAFFQQTLPDHAPPSAFADAP
jgi:hypothetical protein